MQNKCNIHPSEMAGVSLFETKRGGKNFQKIAEGLSLCDFNGILTGQNIEKNGRLNIINKVQTEWSVMICAKNERSNPIEN